MASRLIHNRTKTGQQKVLEQDSATPGPTQPRAPGDSFDLLEVTAVGGTVAGDPTAPGDGGKVSAPPDVPARKSYPTPGGGLPGLLARTQLGLGDAIRSFRESAGRATAAPKTENPAVSDAAVAAPASADEVPSAESPPPPASSGETAAVAAAEARDDAGAVAVSGPVFDLATGPMAGSGPVSGPVFDLVSGPFSGPATTVSASAPGAVDAPNAPATTPDEATPPPTAEQAAPRQSSGTPASGRLAALLAESRKRTGRHETLDKVAEPSASAAGAAVGAPTAVPATGDAGPAFQDVATMRVPGAELAQKKGPGFAATLLGLPAPELTPPIVKTGGAAAATATMRGRERPVRDGARDRGADGNTPLLVEGDATERSLLSSGDLRRRWSRSSDEQKRTTDIIDIVRPNRSGMRAAALILGGAAVLVMVLVAVARVNRSSGDKKNSVTAVPAAPAPAARALPSTPTPAPDEAPPPAAMVPDEASAGEARNGEAAKGEAVKGEAVKGEAVKDETKSARTEAKAIAPAAADVEAAPRPLPSAFRNTGSSPATRSDDGESKRKVARSESRRSDTRRAEPKTRRRNVEARSARSEGTATAASYETQRPRMAQPIRPVQSDPDGTLPLGVQ